MKTKYNILQVLMRRWPAVAGAAALILATAPAGRAVPAGTAFTYQGRLYDGTSAASGFFDFRFTMHGDPIVAAPVSTVSPYVNPIVLPNQWVTNGLFSIDLNFGANVFNGLARWLEVEVRPAGGSTFVALAPRQELKPTPYALHAQTAATAASVPWSAITGVPATLADGIDADTTYGAGLGLILGGGNFSLDTGFTDSLYWKLGGNLGTDPAINFLGTVDNRPLVLRANNEVALRLIPNAPSPNVVGGHSANTIDPAAFGSVVGGGGNGALPNRVESPYSMIGGGLGNTIEVDEAAFLGGGQENYLYGESSVLVGGVGNGMTNAYWSVIGGGESNVLEPFADHCSILGGNENRIEKNSFFSAVGGGRSNRINATYGTLSGGQDNLVTGQAGTVPGGRGNEAAGDYSLAAGRRAHADHNGSFVWADDTDADFRSTQPGQFLIRARNGVGIGTDYPYARLHSVASESGTGVRAESDVTGTAVEGIQNSSGTRGSLATPRAGVEAGVNSDSKNALLINRGRIAVAGAGLGSATPVFIHRATAANTIGNWTTINNPYCTSPRAILLVTPNWNPDWAGSGSPAGVYNNHPIGVWFTGTGWAIFNQDLADMPLNAAFNVMVIHP